MMQEYFLNRFHIYFHRRIDTNDARETIASLYFPGAFYED